MDIKFIDLKRGYERYGAEIEKAVSEVLRSCAYLNGPKTQELERILAEYLGVNYGIGVSSGTEALYLILKALNFPENSYIFVPSFTFIATSEVVIRAGLIPYFVDIDEKTYNIDVTKIKENYEKLN